VKIKYRDFLIDVWKAPGTYGAIHYSAIREADGYCLDEGVVEGTVDTKETYTGMLKSRIDYYYGD